MAFAVPEPGAHPPRNSSCSNAWGFALSQAISLRLVDRDRVGVAVDRRGEGLEPLPFDVRAHASVDPEIPAVRLADQIGAVEAAVGHGRAAVGAAAVEHVDRVSDADHDQIDPGDARGLRPSIDERAQGGDLHRLSHVGPSLGGAGPRRALLVLEQQPLVALPRVFRERRDHRLDLREAHVARPSWRWSRSRDCRARGAAETRRARSSPRRPRPGSDPPSRGPRRARTGRRVAPTGSWDRAHAGRAAPARTGCDRCTRGPGAAPRRPAPAARPSARVRAP